MTQPQYKKEFPDFDASPEEVGRLLELGFQDYSWHNDVCPRFIRPATHGGPALMLWFDYQDPSERELPNTLRCELSALAYFEEDDPEPMYLEQEGSELKKTESLHAVLSYVRQMDGVRWPSWVTDFGRVTEMPGGVLIYYVSGAPVRAG